MIKNIDTITCLNSSNKFNSKEGISLLRLPLFSLLIFCYLLTLTSCNPQSTRAFIPLSTESKYTPTDYNNIEVYITKMPDRGYDEIGVLYVPIFTHSGDLSKCTDRIKQLAAESGAHAVIRLDQTGNGLKGVAIRWK